MKKTIILGIVVLAAGVNVFSQKPPTANPRVIVTNNLPPAAKPTPRPVVVQTPVPSATPLPRPAQTPTIPVYEPGGGNQASNLTYRGLSFSQIKSKLAEAKRQMQSRPLTTALVDPVKPGAAAQLVRIAYYDWRSQQIDYVVVTKDQFLTANMPMGTASTHGKMMTVRTIRANGVNTPITVLDENGQPQLPLMIQYPVEKNGRFIETAYYMSTHPGLVTPEVVNAGRFYVHNVIEIARDRLRERGVMIQPKVADIAERLATLEHVDHMRFKTEFPANIYNDIFTLYALNEGQTFRYSVSSAGAGGMVQMIPSTYAMIRSHYPSVAMTPDFVEGMRNHVNATEAMLLYMQMTWNDLASSPTISKALASGIATQDQLMAAGYNSNPAKLPGYINRGGRNWTSLIPNETKMYLQIYDSLQRAVSLTPRKQ